MELARYNSRVTDAQGNLILDAVVRVRRMTAGRPRPVIYRDVDGTQLLVNPFTLDPEVDEGRIAFHVAGGFYEIRVTSPSRPGFEDIQEWVPIGTLAGYDYGSAGMLSFDWDAVVPLLADRDEHDEQPKGFSVLVESDEDHDDLPVVYYKLSDDEADWSGGLVFPAIRMKAGVTICLDSMGAVIATGAAWDQPVPFPSEIIGWSLISSGEGSIELDIRKSTFAEFPPSESDSITGSSPPTLVAATKAEDFALDGWSPLLDENDYLQVYVNSASGITKVTLTLFLRRR